MKLIPYLICLVITGCGAIRYSGQMSTDLHSAKIKVVQLHRGMKREDVEVILRPLPYFDPGIKISGYVTIQYLLSPGVWVCAEFDSGGALVREPQQLIVSHDDSNNVYREIRLSQIQ